ncbi:hypothetical protein B296_00044620, partial [Ensete ventricosum]
RCYSPWHRPQGMHPQRPPLGRWPQGPSSPLPLLTHHIISTRCFIWTGMTIMVLLISFRYCWRNLCLIISLGIIHAIILALNVFDIIALEAIQGQRQAPIQNIWARSSTMSIWSLSLSFTEAFSSNSLSIGYFHSKYGLQDNTIDFIGHALALHRDDSYLDEPAIDTIKKMKVNPLLPCTLILDHDGLLRICHAYLFIPFSEPDLTVDLSAATEDA